MYVQISELFLAIMCGVCRLVEIIMIIMLKPLVSLFSYLLITVLHHFGNGSPFQTYDPSPVSLMVV